MGLRHLWEVSMPENPVGYRQHCSNIVQTNSLESSAYLEFFLPQLYTNNKTFNTTL